MNLNIKMINQVKTDLKTYHDLMGENEFIKKIIKSSLEGVLDAVLTEPFRYEKYSRTGRNTGT